MNDFASRASAALVVLLAASTTIGCANRQRVLEATVINGVSGTATAVANGVEGVAPGELLVTYPDSSGHAVTEHAGTPAQVDFVHYVNIGETARPPRAAGGSASAREVKAPHLLVTKTVALDDNPRAPTIEVDVDLQRARGRGDASISYFFEIRNNGNGPATAAMLVDALPEGFEVGGVDVYDTGGHAAWHYIPPILPVFWILLPGLTWPGAQSKTSFDSISWDVRAVGGRPALVIVIQTPKDPFDPGDFAILRVTGKLPLPPPAQVSR